MHNDFNFRAGTKNDKHEARLGLVWAFLKPITAKRRLAIAFLVTLLMGILSSSTSQKTALCAGITITILAVWSSRRAGALASAQRTGAIAAEAAQRYSSTLLLNTITHFSRIERLIKRPSGLADSRE